MNTCGICFTESIGVDVQGVKCCSAVEEHWFCGDCLVRHAQKLTEDTTRFTSTSISAGGLGIPCPGVHEDTSLDARPMATKACDSVPIPWKTVMAQVTDRTLLGELCEMMHRLVQSAEANRQQSLQERRDLMDEVTAAAAAAASSTAPNDNTTADASSSQAGLVAILRNQVTERALTLRCPNCDIIVAQDWNGCAAVRCDSASGGCSHYFCAICFYQSDPDVPKGVPLNDQDVHRHVALQHGSEQKEAIAPIRFNGRLYYTSGKTHKEAHERIRCQRVVQLLAPHSQSIRLQVLHDIHPQLNAVEIDTATLAKYFADHFSKSVVETLQQPQQREAADRAAAEVAFHEDEPVMALMTPVRHGLAALHEDDDDEPVMAPMTPVRHGLAPTHRPVMKQKKKKHKSGQQRRFPEPEEPDVNAVDEENWIEKDNKLKALDLVEQQQRNEELEAEDDRRKRRTRTAAKERDEQEGPVGFGAKQKKKAERFKRKREAEADDDDDDDDDTEVHAHLEKPDKKKKKKKQKNSQEQQKQADVIPEMLQWLPVSERILISALPQGDREQVWRTLHALHLWITYEAGKRGMLLRDDQSNYQKTYSPDMQRVQFSDAELRKWWNKHVPNHDSWIAMRNQPDSLTHITIIDAFLRRLFNSRPRGRAQATCIWQDNEDRGGYRSKYLRDKAVTQLAALANLVTDEQ